MYTDGQILCHVTSLNGLNNTFFKRGAEVNQLLIVVQLASLCKPSGPSKDTGHWVCGGRVTLLVLPPMPGHRACTICHIYPVLNDSTICSVMI